ncbi:hypothetical protein LPJ53_003999 [Coemansia erecta]|uniref:P-loop containing nucleoside triphosphate hydrolase protein n=1 Tax=Coemansia erecta TaxID=147472 RepID=A0A9W7XYS2_9FUNG|nr:hypothetical protein LPJ53_003999 [Coemansia erecta]
MFTCTIALAASAAEMLHAFSQTGALDIFVISLGIQTFAAAMAIRMLVHEQTSNPIPSTPLLLFWLTVILLSAMRLRTAIAIGMVGSNQTVVAIIGVYLVATLATFILELQSKEEAFYSPTLTSASDSDNAAMTRPPEEYVNIFSRLTFSWITPLVNTGYKRPLEMADIWDLGPLYNAKAITQRFYDNWEHEMEHENPSLIRAMTRTYWHSWVLGGIYKIGRDMSSFLNPILLSRLIGFVGKYGTIEAEPIEYGYFYAIAIFVVAFMRTLTLEQHWYQNQRLKCQLMAGNPAIIYQKMTRLSSESRQKYGVGSIVTHMSVDSLRIMEFLGNQSHNLWSAPMQVITSLYLLYQTLGWSMLAGVAIMVISSPLSTHISHGMGAVNKKLMEYRDQRLKIMDEVLSGIKAIKLYAWEAMFIQRIADVRNRLELSKTRHYGYMQALFYFVMTLVPFAVSFTTFSLHCLINGGSASALTPQNVFVALTLFNMLRAPLSQCSAVIPSLLEAMVSYNRLRLFFLADEIDATSVDFKTYNRNSPDSSSDDVLVSVSSGTFKWNNSDTQPALSDIDLECKRSELVAVIGKVGSGKSSLVSAILGEMVKDSGNATVTGSIAYAPQQPWILNATLRDNILFGHCYEQDFYNRVIEVCALGPDLEMLPAGDMTEIGENGINLSGGQKARVSLARAVYARADIYILDDPLAAVDAYVGRHIFTHVLGPQGILRSRARILVTNAVQYLSRVDRVVMLRDGTVAESGSFINLMEGSGHVYEFVHRFIDGADHFGANSSTYSRNGGGSSSSSIVSVSEFESSYAIPVSTNRSLLTVGVTASRRATEEAFGYATVDPGQGSRAAEETPSGQTITVETKQQGKVEWSIYQTYARACGHRNVVIFGGALLLAATSNILANFWLKNWASSNTKTESIGETTEITFGTVSYYLGIYGLLGMTGAMLTLVQSLYLWTRCAFNASKIIHENLLHGVLRSPMSFFDTTPLGRIINRFSTDIRGCDEQLPRSTSVLVSAMITVISGILVIGFSMPPMLFLIVPLTFVYRQLQQRYLFSNRDSRRLMQINKSPIFSHFQESINGISTIRAYRQQARFTEGNEYRLTFYTRAFFTNMALYRWLSLRLETLGNIIVFGTTLFQIVALHFYDYGNAGLAGLTMSYAFEVINSLNWSARSITDVETNMISLERSVEYAQLPSEAPEIIEDNRPAESWPAHGMIEFINYSTRYRRGLDLVLRDISFCVLPMQKVGIVGRTGAGKSSLTLALFRIIEATSGKILIDGQDISQYGLYDVRSKLSIIPQDPVLFAGSVRKNLDPFGNFSDQQIWSALEHAHLAEVVRSKGEGLDYAVLKDGDNFSVGQRQLICLARALLKRAKVLVLDEATAAIDNETDAIIQQTIRREFRDCTVLTIAHRLNTVMDSDMILVIDNGMVAEYDTPDNLLANRYSIFTSLVSEASIRRH